MRMILSDIGKVLWKALSAVVTTTSNIAFCAGSLVVGAENGAYPPTLNGLIHPVLPLNWP